MNKAELAAYDRELRRVAALLGLQSSGDLEAAIIQHCLLRFGEWLSAHGGSAGLCELVDLFAASLNMRIEEVHSPADFRRLLQEIPPVTEPAMARLESEFDEDTDAVTILRVGAQAWEQPYLAVINCQDWHSFRRYWTKWHEIVHRLLEGQQLTFALRKTQAERPQPAERLVDAVVAHLAFYPAWFVPVLEAEVHNAGRLTFDVVDRVREEVAAEASRQATLQACLTHTRDPMWFVRCRPGYKRDEERLLKSPQMGFFPRITPEPKLRVRESVASPAAPSSVRFHENMQVPLSSAVRAAFNDEWARVHTGYERLDDWTTSSDGPIGTGTVYVEAARQGRDVIALLTLENDREPSS